MIHSTVGHDSGRMAAVRGILEYALTLNTHLQLQDCAVKVFFYGLFMDERLLATKGIKPSEVSLGFVDGFGLRIGERATLIRHKDSRAYGVVMDIAPDEAAELYSEDSVADYLPEPVLVQRMDGSQVDATCYNLPDDEVFGANTEYAELLLKLATQLGFPGSYLDRIRQARTNTPTVHNEQD